MFRYSESEWNRFERWMPLSLFMLPTAMVLLPLIMPIHPFAAIRFTPILPLILQAWLIVAGLRSQPLAWQDLIPNNRLVLLTTILFIVIALTTSVAVAPIWFYSLLKLLDLFLLAAVSYFAAAFFARGGARLVQNTLIAVVASLVVGAILVSVLFYYRVPTYFWWPNFMPGFAYVRIYGFAMTVGVAIAAGLLAVPRFTSGGNRLPLLLALTFLWAVLFWTGTRGGVIALMVSFSLLALVAPKFRRILPWVLLTMVVGAVFSLPLPIPGPLYGIFGIYSDTVGAQSAQEFSSGRWSLWSQTLSFISRKPWFGHGYAQLLSFAAEMKHPFTHVHNIVLEAALAWGWIGAACAGFLGVRLWLIGFLKTKEAELDENVPAFLLVTALLVYAFVDGTYYYYQTLIPFALCVGILASGLRSDDEGRDGAQADSAESRTLPATA